MVEPTAQDMQEIAIYSRAIAGRSRKLGENVSLMDLRLDDARRQAMQLKRSSFVQMQDLKMSVAELSSAVKEVQKAIILLIGQMKSTVKSDELAKLERRIDVWSPHVFVSQAEAERLLKKI